MKHKLLKYHEERAFTLVELLVTMAIFLVVMVVATQTFNNIYTNSTKYSKMEESNIEGIIGLELMRHDLEQMGFGLPWGFLSGSTISYNEGTADTSTNDSPNGVPRAFVGLDNSAAFGSDFFGLKGSTLGLNKVSQRWSNIPFQNFSGAGGKESRPVVWPSSNLQVDDRVIAIRSNFNDETDDHLLIDSSGTYGFKYKTSGIDDAYLPQDDQQMHMIYGIDGGDLRMPFNRADFFIQSPAHSPSCAPGTGILNKGVVNQIDGTYSSIGLLDCVADMQVVLGWDTSSGGTANSVDAYSSLPDDTGGTVSSIPAGAQADIEAWLKDPKGIREHLKVIKVYILAQVGKSDRNYNSPASYDVGDRDAGQLSLSGVYNLTATQQKYRWKVYRIIASPKNLNSNQH